MTAGVAPLVVTAALHAVLAVACGVALGADAAAIGGVHPATKPLKFAVSIALLLATVAWLLPLLSIGPSLRGALAWTLAATMVVEMAVILLQASRGHPSHFNVGTPVDAALWNAMVLAIVVATLALIALALAATLRPVRGDPLVAAAIRIGLWLILLVAVSGFAMGGRMQHAVGGTDGGAGLPITGWSRSHGDLRVPHFFALHGLQALPGGALVLRWLPLAPAGRWVVFAVLAAAWVTLSVVTLANALAGRPLRG